jgi:hypothetical protein
MVHLLTLLDIKEQWCTWVRCPTRPSNGPRCCSNRWNSLGLQSI